MILIDSLYINNSGGKVLLDYLVSELERRNVSSFYLFDSRCENDFVEIPSERKIYLKSNLKNRILFYAKNKQIFSSVFCFGNIPPPIKLKVPVYTYFHNILRAKPFNYNNILKRFFVYLKKIYIKKVSSNTLFYIVQTEYVKKIVCNEFDIKDDNCKVYPFFYINNYGDILNKTGKDSFVYISNGYQHKNHEKLLDAWEILAKGNIYPKLHLTITNDYLFLIQRIEKLQKKGLNIYNYGFVNPQSLYSSCKFVIYPSLNESFGLGLIEGAVFGCFVLASDKEFVHNVIKPSFVFDPNSENDIASTVIFALNNKMPNTDVLVENLIDKLIKMISNVE